MKDNGIRSQKDVSQDCKMLAEIGPVPLEGRVADKKQVVPYGDDGNILLGIAV